MMRKSFAWTYLDQIQRSGSLFLIWLLATRYFTIESIGLLTYFRSWHNIIVGIGLLGLDSVIIKTLHESKNKGADLKNFAFIIHLRILSAITFTAMLLILTLWHVVFASEKVLAMMAVLLLPLFNAGEVLDLRFKAKEQVWISAKSRFWVGITFLCLRVLLLKFGQKSFAIFLFSFPAEYLFIGLSYYRISGETWPMDFNHWKESFEFTATILKRNKYYIFGNIFILIYLNIDQVIISHLLKLQDLAIYGVAVQWSNIWSYLPVLGSAAIFPTLLRMKNDQKNFDHFVAKYFLTFTLIPLAIIFVMSYAGADFIEQLYPEKYAGVASILKVYIWTTLFVFQGVCLANWAVLQDLQNDTFIFSMIGGLSNIVLNFILIPAYGLKGAAIASIVSYGLSSPVGPMFHPRLRKGAIKLFCSCIDVFKRQHIS